VDRAWPAEATSFAEATRAALERSGGLERARAAEQRPADRLVLGDVFDTLGLATLDPTAGETEGFAAAAALREAGRVLSPWPLVPGLVARASGAPVAAVYVVDRWPSRLEHLDVVPDAAVVDLRSSEAVAAHAPAPAPSRLDPFGVAFERGLEIELDADAAVVWHTVLLAHWLLGALGRATELAVDHARERRQFGQSLASFGAIKWRLSDIELARAGLEELAAFTLWLATESRCGRADVLALRLASAEAARCVLDNAHQILAAIGLCDEHDLSLISRHVQAPVRRAGSAPALAELLADAVAAEGFSALYDVAPAVAAAAISRPS
jgi:acyl-CoA dehydrogenase